MPSTADMGSVHWRVESGEKPIDPVELVGAWEGTLKAGGTELRIEVTIDPGALDLIVRWKSERVVQ